MSGVAKLLTGGDKPAPAPVITPREPAVLPTPNDAAIQRARARRRRRLSARQGRASTVLTDRGEFVNEQLGN